MWLISFWIFPVISACMWLGTLLALFCRWEVEGHPHLPSMDPGQTIAYISDTGAYGLKPLFITGCVITTVFLDLAFFSERWLRHTGRLAKNTSRAQKILSGLSILFAIAGSAGLILLSIFDTYHHPNLHDGFLVLFIGGFIIQAIFICAEYQRLGIHYRNHRIIRISFWYKLAFILVEVALAIVFGVTGDTNHKNAAAVVEWIIGLIFTGYILTFLLDLLPSVRTKNHIPQGYRDNGHLGMAETGAGVGMTNVGDGEYEGQLTTDSAGPMADGYRGAGAAPALGGTTNGAATNGDYGYYDGNVSGYTADPNTHANGAMPDGKKKNRLSGRLHF